MILRNEVGNKYGKLTVLERAPKELNKYGAFWLCICECGNTVTRLGVYLRSHTYLTPSCGCVKINGPRRKVKDKVLRTQFTAYKNSKSGLKKGFNLSLKEFEEVSRKDCFYCGESPVYRRVKYDSDSKGPLYAEDYLNGIDRLNNEKGYTLDNCVPACPKCNHMKSTLTKDEFIVHITKILNFQIQ
jgi:5-methylcytosine-specific restriction endonuclease McrA